MVDYDIYYLADKKEYINACAAWAYGRWGVQNPKGSLERAINIFTKGAEKTTIPLTLIALNKQNGLPIAMGSLWEKDGDDWLEISPWIASVYTLYRYRGLGIGKAIIIRLEREAKRLGFNEIYLQSGSAAALYPKLGYTEIDSIKTESTSVGKLTLFKKTLE